MRAQPWAALLAASLFLGAGLARAQQVGAPLSSLAAQDQEIQALYQNLNTSMVHIAVTQSAQAIIEKEGLQEKFDAWQKAGSPGPTNPSGRTGRSGRGNPTGGDNRGTPQTRPEGTTISPSGGPGFGRGGGGGGGGNPPGPGGFGRGGGGGPGQGSQISRFLQYQAEQEKAAGNPDMAAHLLGQALRVQINPGGFQGENLAILLDAQGHALLLGGIFKEAAKPMNVGLPDGSTIDAGATYVGADLYAGFTIVKLNSVKGLSPTGWSRHKLAQGQMLLPITQGQSFVPAVHVQARFGEAFSEDRLPADEQSNPRFERGGAFLFDITGSLAAVVTSGGGISGERFALSGTRMRREIDYILNAGKDGRDIEPRPLGVAFIPSPSAPGTPSRRAVQISAITKGSLAEDAKLKIGDVLLSIDNRPMAELVTSDGRSLPGLVQLQVDLVTRTGDVPLTVVREGKEITLPMPLGAGN